MTVDWYYISADTIPGPVPFERFEHLLASRLLPRSTLVWRSGMVRRAPATTTPEFQRCASQSDASRSESQPETDSRTG